jgi:hypothetical protein
MFSSDIWQLDLHNMSVGTASIVFPLWLSSLRDRFQRNDGLPVEVRLITGWGKHSKADVKAPVRKMILAELEALKNPFKADNENRGAFITRGSSLKKYPASGIASSVEDYLAVACCWWISFGQNTRGKVLR